MLFLTRQRPCISKKHGPLHASWMPFRIRQKGPPPSKGQDPLPLSSLDRKSSSTRRILLRPAVLLLQSVPQSEPTRKGRQAFPKSQRLRLRRLGRGVTRRSASCFHVQGCLSAFGICGRIASATHRSSNRAEWLAQSPTTRIRAIMRSTSLDEEDGSRCPTTGLAVPRYKDSTWNSPRI